MSETYLSLLRFPGDRAVIKIYMAAGEWKNSFGFVFLFDFSESRWCSCYIVHVAG